MAAIAIPIVVLGSLYILSEQEKKNKENFQQQIDDIQNTDFKDKEKEDFRSTSKEGFTNIQSIKMNKIDVPVNNFNTNQHTDKFFSPTTSRTNNEIYLMNGEKIDQNGFKHNNMKPFFGAKIRGTQKLDNTESILDSKQGYGSQSFSKSEQAPLFTPNENMNLTYGTQNNNNFIQSRINESMKMNNVSLWEPQRVGPGLNSGYGVQDNTGYNKGGTEGTDGFNAGMTSRETWMPKNIDELRVDTNPKQIFDLNGHQGPANSSIKLQGSNKKIGKVEKHAPDKYYESGPNRLFTTTGIEKAPTIRSQNIIPLENRPETTRDYFGTANNNLSGNAIYSNYNFEESKKQNLGSLPISNLSTTQHNSNQNDFSQESYNILPNNRTINKNTKELGGIYGMAKAVISPLFDILQPTRKENTINNLRQNGNVNGSYKEGHLYNDLDKTKTTNREMTTNKINMNYLNVQGQNHRTGYLSQQYQAVKNQRDTTNKEYIGTCAKPETGIRSYNSAYSQHNNVNKTYESRTNHGNMSIFNNNNNISINRNENVLENNREQNNCGGVSMIPSQEFIGEMNGLASYDSNFNSNRINPDLLNAFKNNPYTKSLTST
tara:strand:+ start:2008 stop:3813 length:1806 start_codon:yes stop_codon:yes gene_type:complete